MHKKYKEELFFITIALTLLLAACGNSEEIPGSNVVEDDQINISVAKEENSLIIETSPKFFRFIRPQDSFESLGTCYINNVGHFAYEWWTETAPETGGGQQVN